MTGNGSQALSSTYWRDFFTLAEVLKASEARCVTDHAERSGIVSS
jgi:hypothetical protein